MSEQLSRLSAWADEFAGAIRVVVLAMITGMGGLVLNMSGDVRVINDRMEGFGETRRRLEGFDVEVRARIDALERRVTERIDDSNARLREIERLGAVNQQRLAEINARLAIRP
jgi:hypothetical protein